MKSPGSNAAFSSERARDLLAAYFRHIDSCPKISMTDTFRAVVDMPAARFWVSTTRAAIVIAKIIRGDKLTGMRPPKREMFFEIHRRVVNLRHRYPSRTIPRLIEEVVAGPAPKFYLSPGTARIIILDARKKWFKESETRARRLASK